MPTKTVIALHVANIVGPILVAVLYICACSFFKEPNRRNFNAIMIAGAGAIVAKPWRRYRTTVFLGYLIGAVIVFLLLAVFAAPSAVATLS